MRCIAYLSEIVRPWCPKTMFCNTNRSSGVHLTRRGSHDNWPTRVRLTRRGHTQRTLYRRTFGVDLLRQGQDVACAAAELDKAGQRPALAALPEPHRRGARVKQTLCPVVQIWGVLLVTNHVNLHAIVIHLYQTLNKSVREMH